MELTPRFPHFLHGGDYNPDQWLDRPDILEKDVELMQKAHVNCVSIAIFAWARLEPEDGVYDFTWLDEVIDRLWKGGIHVILATPSGARPAWMAQKYPEVLRVNKEYQQMHFGERHNHCPSSPVYRRKVREMDTALAKRYAQHPAVILWHLSNEFSGECHCPRCQQAFRDWLKEKYGTLEELNKCWWTGFWSQRYSDWSQIEAPSPLGEFSSCAMTVDWKRFLTDQCKSFIEMERDAVQSVDPSLKVTVNMMERFQGYDYFSMAESIDVVSWDSYPSWHSGDDLFRGAEFAMHHDIMRSLKDAPFILMESTPSQVNWKPHNKLKEPGMHLLSSLQAVAHGSQSVLYFQWRKGRGGGEMFHGAVVDHYGESDTRVFADVTEVGTSLEKLEPIYQTQPHADVCIIFDWENWWAIDQAQTGQKGAMHYFDVVLSHYRALWEQGISVDFRDMRPCTDLSRYKLVIAPMLFMFRHGFEQKLHDFVENGGTLVSSYFTGVVDEHYLAYLGPTPHGLTDVFGFRAAELDALFPNDSNALVVPGRAEPYKITELCELLANCTAEAKGVYASNFYQGQPCVTVNSFGKGKAWYIAAKVEDAYLQDFYKQLAPEAGVAPIFTEAMPKGVVPTTRGKVTFLQNFSMQEQTIHLAKRYHDLLHDSVITGDVVMPKNGLLVVEEG